MAPSKRQPPSQSVRGYANHLAAPQRPCPSGDVTRASFCLALQGLRQKQQRSWGKPAGEGPFVRKEYYYFPHRRLWNKHALSSQSLRVETQPWTARTSPLYLENKGGGCFFCSATIFLSTSSALIHLHWPIVSENRVQCLSPLPPLSFFLPGSLLLYLPVFCPLSDPAAAAKSQRCPARSSQTAASTREMHWMTREPCRSPWISSPCLAWTATRTLCMTTTRSPGKRASTWPNVSRFPALSMWRRLWADRVCTCASV